MEIGDLTITLHDIMILVFVMTAALGLYFLPIHLMFKKNRSLIICIFVFIVSFAYSNFEAMMFYYCFIRVWWYYRGKTLTPLIVSADAQLTPVQGLSRVGLTLTMLFFYCLIGLWICSWWVGYLVLMAMTNYPQM